MNIRPIRTEEDYDAALKEIEPLMDARAGTADEDRLDVLTTLVEAYEARHYPILPPDPIDALLYYMESRGLSRAELARHLGTRGRTSEILNRKRPLTLPMIRRIHECLGVPADVLVRQYDVVNVVRPQARRKKKLSNQTAT